MTFRLDYYTTSSIYRLQYIAAITVNQYTELVIL